MQPDFKKPSDWPINHREQRLETVLQSFELFLDNPNLVNKEYLLSSVASNDLNELSFRGVVRFCGYEIHVLSLIYFYASITQCAQAKIFLYEYLTKYIEIKKSIEMTIGRKPFHVVFGDIESSHLDLPLRIFFISYAYYIVENDKTFSQQLIATVDAIQSKITCSEDFEALCNDYNLLLNELSFNTHTLKLKFLQFTKKELFLLFKKLITLCNVTAMNPNDRPFKGIFSISLSNWVLNSRHNNKGNYFYKCISSKAAACTLSNQQVWMRDIKDLNDKREGITFKNLLYHRAWIKNDWAKKVSINEDTNRYVCSFSKTKPNKIMLHKYGHNIYGYKNDRIASIISPIILLHALPVFAPVFAYDVLYDSKKAIEEINYIASIIDLFKINNEEKIQLLNNILSYWNLTIKDKKWEYEHERRYEIRIFDSYKYFDIKVEDKYLKVNSTLFVLPDFINKENINHERIKQVRILKLHHLSMNSFVFCHDCLQADYDFQNKHKCKVCGSANIEFIDLAPIKH